MERGSGDFPTNWLCCRKGESTLRATSPSTDYYTGIWFGGWCKIFREISGFSKYPLCFLRTHTNSRTSSIKNQNKRKTSRGRKKWVTSDLVLARQEKVKISERESLKKTVRKRRSYHAPASPVASEVGVSTEQKAPRPYLCFWLEVCHCRPWRHCFEEVLCLQNLNDFLRNNGLEREPHPSQRKQYGRSEGSLSEEKKQQYLNCCRCLDRTWSQLIPYSFSILCQAARLTCVLHFLF